MSRTRAVIRLDDGKVYPSLSAAAADMQVTPGSIGYACQFHGRSKGWRWAYADEVEGAEQPPKDPGASGGLS